MARHEPRPPRFPSRWTAVLSLGVIAAGVAAALVIAVYPVHSSSHRHSTAGCGDAAASIVISGEGSDVRVGHRVESSPCYRSAEKRLVVAGVLLVAPFVIVLAATSVSRRRAG